MLKEERLVAEGAVEEARCREGEQRSRAEGLRQEVEVQRAQVQRHLTQVRTPPPTPPMQQPKVLPITMRSIGQFFLHPSMHPSICSSIHLFHGWSKQVISLRSGTYSPASLPRKSLQYVCPCSNCDEMR